jgi:hypothetical protein
MRRALVAIVATGALSFVAPGVQANETPTSTISTSKMKVIATINGNIAPKSVATSGTGLVSAHNMMYRHSVTIYDTNKNAIIATVPDTVRLSDFGYKKYSGSYTRELQLKVHLALMVNISTSQIMQCMEKDSPKREPINVALQMDMTQAFLAV